MSRLGQLDRLYAVSYNAEEGQYRLIFQDDDGTNLWYVDQDIPGFKNSETAFRIAEALTDE